MKAKYTTKQFKISTQVYAWIKQNYKNVNKGFEAMIQKEDPTFTIYNNIEDPSTTNQLELFKNLSVAELRSSEQ